MFNEELGAEIRGVTPETKEYLVNYGWPGNVRELKNIIQRSMILSKKNVITPEILPEHIFMQDKKEKCHEWETGLTLKELEKRYIEQTLECVRMNKVKAARMLGISRRALYNKIEAYKLC
jgi:DNA-binding NtrC family response regulator